MLKVLVGQIWENFEEYVAKNHRFFQRKLVVMMIKTSESLEFVVDSILNGKKMKNDENSGFIGNQSRGAAAPLRSPKRSPRPDNLRKSMGNGAKATRVSRETMSKQDSRYY